MGEAIKRTLVLSGSLLCAMLWAPARRACCPGMCMCHQLVQTPRGKQDSCDVGRQQVEFVKGQQCEVMCDLLTE